MPQWHMCGLLHEHLHHGLPINNNSLFFFLASAWVCSFECTETSRNRPRKSFAILSSLGTASDTYDSATIDFLCFRITAYNCFANERLWFQPRSISGIGIHLKFDSVSIISDH